jgi:23S rRNA U2552 (ribose-2'-O)-methylase RlmE/FtsJ
MDNQYPFTVYRVPDDQGDDIKDHIKKDASIVLSPFVAEPKLEYGFYYFIHRSKDKTSIQRDPRFRNKYHITNPFEHTVPDYEKDIQRSTETYFKLDKNGVISRAFYKFWEVLMAFDVVPESGSIKTSHIAEAPGGFIQALSAYRTKFFKASDVSKDSYSTISIRSEDTKNVPSFKNTALDKVKRLTVANIDNCDIMKKSIQDRYVKETGLVDLVTADGGFMWKDENYQEQEAYKLIMAEIVLALKLQKKSGCFVIKIFDTFTDVTLKMIAILRTYYKSVHVFIPLTSRPSNSEKYLICQGFQGITPKEVDNLEKIMTQMTEDCDKTDKRYTVDILPSYNLGNELKAMNKTIGVYVVNEQFKSINIMISYLEKGVFFGDDYHRFRDDQIRANEYWLSMFYPSTPSDLKSHRKKIANKIKEAVQDADDKVEKLMAAISG